MKRLHIFLATMIFFVVGLSAQTVWELDLGKKLKEAKYLGQSGDGTVLTTIGGEITGVNPESGEIMFHHKPKTGLLGQPSFRPIPSTSLLEVRAKGSYLLVDCKDNKKLFDYGSKENKVKAVHYLLSENALILEHKKDKESYIGLGKIGDEDLSWDVNLGRVKTSLFVTALKSKSGTRGFLSMDPIVFNDLVLLVLKKELVCINRAKGEISWRRLYEKNLNNVYINNDSKGAFVFYHDRINYVNLDDGSDLHEELKLPGQVIDVLEQDDKFTLLMTNGLNFYYPETNSIKWVQTKKIGNINDYYSLDNGYLGIHAGKDGKYSVYKIDENGQGEWSRELPGALIQLIPNQDGIFYLTTEKANVLDYEHGKKIWKDDVSFKEYTVFTYDEKMNRVLYFGDKKLRRFDPETGFMEQQRKKIEFKKYKKEEDGVYLTSRENGQFLRTDQHLMYMDRDGKLIYEKFFAPVDISKLAKAGLIAGSLAGASVATVNTYGTMYTSLEGASNEFVGNEEVAKQKYESAGRKLNTAIAADEVSRAMGDFYSKKYRNTTEDADYIYLLTRLDKENYIAKVNIESGVLEKKFHIQGREPLYHIDYARDQIYIVDKNNKLKAYATN